MEKIQPGQEVVSLFNFSSPKQSNFGIKLALAKVFAVVSAFFIVIAAAFILNFFSQRLELKTKVAGAAVDEPAAYERVQSVSQVIANGYFGK
ncbi:MAG: hypothetical protein AAB653_02095 [Patescibacteria group bacterium]